MKAVVVVPYAFDLVYGNHNVDGVAYDIAYVCIPSESKEPVTQYMTSKPLVVTNDLSINDLTVVGDISFLGLRIDDRMVRRKLQCVSFDKSTVPQEKKHDKQENVEEGPDVRQQEQLLFHYGPKFVSISADDKKWFIMNLHSRYSLHLGPALAITDGDLLTHVTKGTSSLHNTTTDGTIDGTPEKTSIDISNLENEELIVVTGINKFPVQVEKGVLFIITDQFLLESVSELVIKVIICLDTSIGNWFNHTVYENPWKKLRLFTVTACVVVHRIKSILLIGNYRDKTLVIVSIPSCLDVYTGRIVYLV
jgi:hypothetical protein